MKKSLQMFFPEIRKIKGQNKKVAEVQMGCLGLGHYRTTEDGMGCGLMIYCKTPISGCGVRNIVPIMISS